MARHLATSTAKPNKDYLGRHGLSMVAFIGLALGLNALFQMYMGRRLDDEFSVLISLIAFSMIISVFAQTVQTSVTKFTSKMTAENGHPNLANVNHLWRLSLSRMLVLGVVLFLVLILCTPFISSVLRIDSIWSLIILFSSLVLVFAVPVNQGVLQGLQRFFPLGLCIVMPALLKLFLGVILVALGLGVDGALLPIAIGSVVVFAMSSVFVRDVAMSENEATDLSGLFSYTGLALLAILLLSILIYADVIWSQALLSKDDANTYSAVSVVGKAVFYPAMGMAIAMFPKTSELSEVGGRHGGLLVRALLYTLLLSGGVAIIYWLFPGPIISIVYGGKHSLAVDHLFRYGLAMLFLGLSFVSVNYLLSLSRLRVAYALFLVVLLQVILIGLFHSSIDEVVNVMLICGIASLVLMIPFYVAVRKCSQS